MDDKNIDSKYRVDKEQVKKAVKALYQFIEKKKETTPALIEEHQIISLQLSLKKIPPEYKRINIKLPHTLQQENTETCLITGDLNHKDSEYSKTINYYKDMFKENKVKGITEILPLRALLTEYKAYEAKIRLSKNYDRFLADDKLMGILPKYLGKNFMGTNKHPMQVNLMAANLKKEIDTALSSTRCMISGNGSSYNIEIGHSGLNEDKVSDNILAVCDRLRETTPGGAANIRNLHIVPGSLAICLPIFASFGGEELVEFDIKEKNYFTSEPEEVTTVENGKVQVSIMGDVKIIPDRVKKRAAKKATVKTEIAEADSSSNDSRGPNVEGSRKHRDVKDELDENSSTQGSGESGKEHDKRSREDDIEEFNEEDVESDSEEFDSNEAISDDGGELQFESDYSEESSDEETDMKNLAHIRGLWDEGSDAELDSDQVSDTSMSDTEDHGEKSSKIPPVKPSKKTANNTATSKVSMKKSSNMPQGKASKKRSKQIQNEEITSNIAPKKTAKPVQGTAKKPINMAPAKQKKKMMKDSQGTEDLVTEVSNKTKKKETVKELAVKPSKKKSAKEAEVTQAPPAKKMKLLDNKKVLQNQSKPGQKSITETNIKQSKKRKN